MPRFSDEWLTDRVLFDYVAGGQCACCGLSHLFLPNGTRDLITAVSDLETDQARAEINALDTSPWPAELRDQIWADRVRLRQKLKKEMRQHADFWQQHGDAFCEWCHGQSTEFWKRTFQLPRSEIMEMIHTRYDIHTAFGVVLCAITEQVAHFDLTQYPPDGRGSDEVDFEKALYFSRQGGFTISLVDDSQNTVQADALEMWLNRIKSLGGPKLLTRDSSSKTKDKDDDGDADDAPTQSQSSNKAGFASDRRIIRLLIARYWAQHLQKRYLEEDQKQQQQVPEEAV